MAPKIILILESDRRLIRSYLAILKSMNMDIIPLVDSSGKKAKDFLRWEDIDLIITNPELAGTVISEKLKSIKSKIPLLLITKNPEEPSPELKRRSKIIRYIQAPLQPGEVALSIRTLLQAV